ncbi:hypothetical protein MASR2M79_15750 [Aminivibrio sp.]
MTLNAFQRPDGRIDASIFVSLFRAQLARERMARATEASIVHEQGCTEFEHDHQRTDWPL